MHGLFLERVGRGAHLPQMQVELGLAHRLTSKRFVNEP